MLKYRIKWSVPSTTVTINQCHSKREREGRREGGREGEREGGREGGGREGERGGRERGREREEGRGGRKGGKGDTCTCMHVLYYDVHMNECAFFLPSSLSSFNREKEIQHIREDSTQPTGG